MLKIKTENEFKNFIIESIKSKHGEHGGLKKVSDELGWSKSKMSRIVAKQKENDINTNKASSISLSDSIKLLETIGCDLVVKKK